MSDKDEKLKVEIEIQREIERKIDESIPSEEHSKNYRNIIKMQAPDQWPDPPEKNEESSNSE